MDVEKLFKFTNSLENPKYPLLGPNIRGLYWSGHYPNNGTPETFENKIHDYIFKIVRIVSLFFLISLYVQLYIMRYDLLLVLFNISMAALSSISIFKTYYFIYTLSDWVNLINNISAEEILLQNQNDPKIIKLMRRYTIYSRILSYGYWTLALLTNIVTILTPFGKYLTSPNYREMVKNGTEPYPHIFMSYTPFDQTKMPGYISLTVLHIILVSLGAAVVAFYDSTAVCIMVFLKGYVTIIKANCERIFGEKKQIPQHQVLSNIKECHRMHNFLSAQHHLFNSLLSPVMFLYVLVCSMSICFSVVQLSMNTLNLTQKLWVLEFSFALTFQLFIYCWHSNEIMYESLELSQSIYKSNWWRADVREKKELLLLAGKLSPSYVINAGPFTSFSMTTFIDIMKGAYSFYTLFTQMKDDK